MVSSFYYTVPIIAGIVLVILLFFITRTVSSGAGNQTPFPPFVNTCPDYWKVGPEGKCYLPACGTNTGKLCLSGSAVGENDGKPVGSYVNMDFTGLYIDTTTNLSTNPNQFCSLADWALLNGINWNGVSNTNQCS